MQKRGGNETALNEEQKQKIKALMEDERNYHEKEDKRKIFREKLLAFEIDTKLSQNAHKAKKVFHALLSDSADKPFLYEALEKRHYLELISYWLTYKKPDDVYGELNQQLQKFKLSSYCVTEDKFERTIPFEEWKDDATLTMGNREILYEHILKHCTHHARYIGHFLLSPTVYQKLYLNDYEMEKLLDAIMDEVRQDISPSWACLKALLCYIGCGQVVKEIEKDLKFLPDGHEHVTFEDLHRLIQNGDVSSIEHHLTISPSIVEMRDDDYGQTLLMWASQYNKTSIVRLLLDRGSDIEATNPFGRTSLHLVVLNNYFDCLSLLLKSANHHHPHENPHHLINKQDNNNFTPLHMASFFCSFECVKLLIRHGADRHIKNIHGQTAYDVACQSSDDDEEKKRMREFLLQH